MSLINTATTINQGNITTSGLGAMGAQSISLFSTAQSSNEENASITTQGALAQGLLAFSLTSQATVSNAGSIETNGWQAHGANATSIFNTAVGINTTTGEIKTAGDTAHGMNAFSFTSLASTTNQGKITTQGDNANGMNAVSQYGKANAINEANATINTAGTDAHGAYAQSTHEEAVAINSGTISTTGDGGNGASAISEDAKAAALNDTTGIIHTQGNNAHGLLAQSYQALAVVSNLNQIVTSGHGANGASARSTNGEAQAENLGSITTAGNNADGLNAQSQHNKAYAINKGNILTGSEIAGGVIMAKSGENSHGVSAYSQDDTAVVQNDNNAEVKTYGKGSYGLHAYSVNAEALAVNDGTVETHGDNAYGVSALSSKSSADALNRNSILTTGNGSNGLNAESTQGVAQAVNQGNVETRGDNAYGVNAITQNSQAYAYNEATGNIITRGNNSHGLAASSHLDALAQNDNTIETEGDYSYGIHAFSKTSHAQAINNQSVITHGTGARGVSAESESGDSLAYNQLNVETFGVDGYGLSAVSQRNSAEAINNAQVTTHGAGAIGVHASNIKGTALAKNQNTVTTYGNNAHGLSAFSQLAQAISLNLEMQVITTEGDNAYGMRAETESGSALALNMGNVTTHGQSANGLGAISKSGKSEALNQSNVTTYGDSSYGISAQTDTGSALATNLATDTTYGDNGYGIFAQSNTGSAQATNLATVTTHGQSAYGVAALSQSGISNAVNQSSVTTYGAQSYGIFGQTDTGNLSAINNSQVITYGDGGHGIASLSNAGTSRLDNNAAVVTNGISAHGMHAETNTGDIKMLNQSTIDTLGDGSRGMSAQLAPAQGQIAKSLLMDNLGQINAQGHGMYAESSGPVGSFLVRNTGTINATDGSGIQATTAAGNVTVQATNQINAGQSSAEGTHHGIYAATGANGKASVTYDSGIITLSPVSADITPTGVGIWVDDLATGNTKTVGEINFNNGFINAEQGAGGIGMSLSGTGNINIGKTAMVHGGNSFGIGLGSAVSSEKTRLTVNNYGVVDAISDRVIYSTANAGQTTINNYNQLTGSAQFGSADNTLNNYNRFLLRNYSDSNRDGLRDSWGIASVDMGNGGNNTFINQGTLVLANSANYAINPVSANEIYVPADLTSSYANTDTLTQGQMLGVTRFDHSGVIDLTDGTTSAGNSLVITGGHTPGKNGGGVFVSNGGRVVANMKADDKGKSLFSDVMVVDSARLGTGGPTTVEINHLGENTALAPKNKILVVESLSHSDAGAFQLSTGRQLFGVSDYELEYNTTNNNWYLNTDYRSEVVLASTVFPVANDYAYTMLGSLDTRLGPQHARNTPPPAQIVQSGGDACKKEGLTAKEEVELLISGMCTPKVVQTQAQTRSDSSDYIPEAWGRIIGKKTEHGSNNIEKNGAGYDSYLSGIQLGHDIYRREGADSSMDRAGVYFGYGDTETDINNDRGQDAGSTVTKAYSLGLYWTHQGQQSWYTDTVLQTTYYDVDATSKHSETFSTNGVGVLGSVESGYAFNFNNGVTLEPQAQLAYQHISFDDAKDNHGSFSFKQNDSLRARTGLLVNRDWSLAKDSDSKPHYLRTWAKTDVWHEFMGDATTYAVDKTGKHSTQLKQPSNGTWAEVSVGANYQYNDSMGYSAAGSYSKSLDDRDNKSWGGQVGVNVKW